MLKIFLINCIAFTRTKDTKKFHYKKFRFTDDYHHESEEEKEQQTSKKPDKKEPPKKPTKDDLNKFNKWINKKETGINYELFNKHFKFQRPSDMLKSVYTTNDSRENDDLANLIKGGSSHFTNEIYE